MRMPLLPVWVLLGLLPLRLMVPVVETTFTAGLFESTFALLAVLSVMPPLLPWLPTLAVPLRVMVPLVVDTVVRALLPSANSCSPSREPPVPLSVPVVPVMAIVPVVAVTLALYSRTPRPLALLDTSVATSPPVMVMVPLVVAMLEPLMSTPNRLG